MILLPKGISSIGRRCLKLMPLLELIYSFELLELIIIDAWELEMGSQVISSWNRFVERPKKLIILILILTHQFYVILIHDRHFLLSLFSVRIIKIHALKCGGFVRFLLYERTFIKSLTLI